MNTWQYVVYSYECEDYTYESNDCKPCSRLSLPASVEAKVDVDGVYQPGYK
jgi:hypothetical protein